VDFQKMINALLKKFSPTKLAQRFSCTTSTIYNWRDGFEPHKYFQPKIKRLYKKVGHRSFPSLNPLIDTASLKGGGKN